MNLTFLDLIISPEYETKYGLRYFYIKKLHSTFYANLDLTKLKDMYACH